MLSVDLREINDGERGGIWDRHGRLGNPILSLATTLTHAYATLMPKIKTVIRLA